MTFKTIKDIVTLFEKMGVADNTPIKITVEKQKENKNTSWNIFFNISKIINGKAKQIEIKIKEKGTVVK